MQRSVRDLAMRGGLDLPRGLHFDPGDEIEGELGIENGDEEIVHDNGLQNRIKALEANNQLADMARQHAALLADPDIQAVLKAKEAKQKVKVVEEKPEEKKNPKLTIAEDDPLKETLGRIDGRVEAHIEGLKSQYESTIQELKDRLAGIEGVAQQTVAKEVNAQIATTKEKFKDFDKYKPKMLELSKALPGLSVEELYILAKQRAGALKITMPSTESERPNSLTPTRSSPKARSKENEPKRAPGRRGFDQLLQEALKGDLLAESE